MKEFERFDRDAFGWLAEIAFFALLGVWMSDQAERHEAKRRNRRWFSIF